MLDHLPYYERDTNYLTRVMVITLHLACLLTRMLEHHTNTEEMTKLIHQSIYKLVKLKIKAKFGRSILHLSCCRDVAVLGRYPSCQFPSPHLAEVCICIFINRIVYYKKNICNTQCTLKPNYSK